jgi:hypothetical protein
MVREPTCARHCSACFACARGGRKHAGALSLAPLNGTRRPPEGHPKAAGKTLPSPTRMARDTQRDRSTRPQRYASGLHGHAQRVGASARTMRFSDFTRLTPCDDFRL